MFSDAELSRRRIDKLLKVWAATLICHGDSPPIANHQDLHQQINAIELGNVDWENVCLKYNGPHPEVTRPPEWKTTEYVVWYRNPRQVIKNILANPDFDGHIDYVAYQEFNGEKRQYGNVMSGDWSWRQSVRFVCLMFLLMFKNHPIQDNISQDPSTHGSMFIPTILGSDKTMVSVATGQNDFHPLYLSIGNIQSHIRRAHKNGLVLIGFLPIPKGPYPTILFLTNRTLTAYNRCKERHRHGGIPGFQEGPNPQIGCYNSSPAETLHDNPRYCAMP